MTYLPDCNWIMKSYLDSKENHHPTTPSLFKRTIPEILKIKNSLLFTIIFVAFAQVCWGVEYVVNDYRTHNQNGSSSFTWSNPGSWDRYSGTGWAVINSVDLIPDSLNSATVYIRSGAKLFCNNISIPTIYSAKTLIFEGTGAEVTVEAGAILRVTGTTTLISEQNIILKSASGKTALFKSEILNSGTGTIKVERYMSITDKWHLYSSPVSGQSFHQFIEYNSEIPDLFDDPNPDNLNRKFLGVGMREYNTSQDKWAGYFKWYADDHKDPTDLNLPIGNLEPGKGYSIRTILDGESNGTIASIGKPVNSTSLTLDTKGNRWNLIGNPFTCTLSIPKFLSANSGSSGPLEDSESFLAVYVWDTNGTGDYLTLNYISDIKSVQLSQGFFVKSKSSGGTVQFNQSMQFLNPALSFKSAEIEWPTIKVKVVNQTNKSSTEIKLIPFTSKGLDPGYDAGMLKANPDFAIYSKLLDDNGVDFTLQCLPDKNLDQYVIPIGIDCKTGGDLTFTTETVNLPTGCQALLEDRLIKKFTRLDLKDAKYTATVSAETKGTGRFFLHTSDVISSVQPIEKEPFKISKIGKTLYINGEVSDKANFFVYSVNGKQLANFKAVSQVQNQFDASGFPAGVYILTCDDQNQKKSIKFVIEN